MLNSFDKVYIKIPEINFFEKGFFLHEYKHDKNYYFIFSLTEEGFYKLFVVNKKYISVKNDRKIILENINKNKFLYGLSKLDLRVLYLYSTTGQFATYMSCKVEPNAFQKLKYFFKKSIKQLAF